MRAGWYCALCRCYQLTAGQLLQPDVNGYQARICADCADGKPSPVIMQVAQVYRNRRGDTVAYGRVKPHRPCQ